ncbi:cytochrome P450 [Clavulina sp. PMI_390]|nr:cytochrome P450 [Clavulina sp. PMI_390]
MSKEADPGLSTVANAHWKWSIPNLPYFEAVVKEVLRWQPPAPLSIPTLPRKADSYGEDDIPLKTTVLHNIWAISRDEKMYPNADLFNPDRWLVTDPPRDPRLWAFGMGRRICPGMGYAEAVYPTIFMTILSTVNISPTLDQNGREVCVDPTVPTTGRVISVPIPFSYRMHPRSEAAVSLLHTAMSE